MNERTTTTFFRVDEGFKNLIPPLTAEERNTLEKECVDYGIRDALVIADYAGSQGLVLIDGHNRYEISQKHNLSFKTERLSFESRADAEAWVIRNQLGRRNIPNYVRAELALKLKPVIAEKAKENVLAAQNNSAASAHQKSDKQINTNKELAKAAGVSHDTIHKVEKIQKEAPEETKEALRRGELSINAVYSGIVAAENETKRQQEARELREAKHRAESFGNEKVVAIGDAKQNTDDNKLIFEEFKERLYKARSAILQAAISLNEETTLKAIRAADRRELIKERDDLSECYRKILKLQRVVTEVLDEKQPK